LWSTRTLSTFQTFARGQDSKGNQITSHSTLPGYSSLNRLNGNHEALTSFNNSVNEHNGLGPNSLSSGSPSSVSSSGSPKQENSSSASTYRNGYVVGGGGGNRTTVTISNSNSGGGTLGRSNGINKAKPVPAPTLNSNSTHLRSKSVDNSSVYQNGMTMVTLPSGPTSGPLPSYHQHQQSLSYSSMDSDFMSTYIPTEADV
jgi:hypothetical protein